MADEIKYITVNDAELGYPMTAPKECLTKTGPSRSSAREKATMSSAAEGHMMANESAGVAAREVLAFPDYDR